MTAMAPTRSYHVLLVEDDAADAMLIEESLLEVAEVELTQVSDGVAALAYLRDWTSRRPDLIVLDLNMPRMNGTELLKILKEDDDLKVIPVVVLTTSAAPEDVSTAYGTHASSYVVKPVNLEDFTRTVRSIDTFYRETAAHIPDN